MLDFFLQWLLPVLLTFTTALAAFLAWSVRKVPDLLAQGLVVAASVAEAWVRHAKTTPGTEDDRAAELAARVLDHLATEYARQAGTTPPRK